MENMCNAKELEALLQRQKYDFVVYMADLVENKDKDAKGHVDRTAKIVKSIGKELLKRGMYKEIVNEKYVEDLLLAAPMHDIGKIRISDTLLFKPGRLTEDEFSEVKKHVVYGSEIVRGAFGKSGETQYVDMACDIANYHHEKFNGTGYPEGLKGEEIPLSARIMAIADVFDALSGKRCYKEALPIDDVYEIMEEDSGVQFDPEILAVFMDMRDEIINLK